MKTYLKLSNRDVTSLQEQYNSKKGSAPICIVLSVAGSAGFENGYHTLWSRRVGFSLTRNGLPGEIIEEYLG